MGNKSRYTNSWTWLAFVTVVLLLPNFGCIGWTSVLIHAWKGHLVDAAFDGLEDHRVAVVCVSESTGYGPSSVADGLARAVEKHLRENVSDISVVTRTNIDDWMDHNDWNGVDVLEIGEGVDAEQVVAVQLNSFRLHEGQTMYKGRAEVSIAVYDITRGGEEVFSTIPKELVYPTNGAYGATDTTDARFRRMFVRYLAYQISKHFYAYDITEDFASDMVVVPN